MSRYLNPTNDVSFRKLFGTEEHKPLLISFLNSILGLKEDRKIKEVMLLPKEQAPLIQEAKSTILDIKCTDQRNFQYIVEMQNKSVPGFIKRTQFYVAHSYVTQFPAGSDYLDLRPVILLAMANYVLFPSKKRVVSYHKTLDTETLSNDLQEMSYVFVELPKFDKQLTELETVKDQWLYFFKNWSETQEIPSHVEAEIAEAYRSMEEYNWSQVEREAYIKANIALTDEFDARRQERQEGREEGRQEGIALGEEKGREEGIALGEEKGKHKIALEMLSRDMDLALISQLTGLNRQALEKLREDS